MVDYKPVVLSRKPLRLFRHAIVLRRRVVNDQPSFILIDEKLRHSRRVALGSSQQSRGEDAHADTKQAEIRPPLEMDSDPASGFPPDPGDAGGAGAIHKSSVDIADVNRSGQCDVLARA